VEHKTHIEKKIIICRHSERWLGTNAPSFSSNINRDENYCGVRSGYYYDDKAGEQWVKCLGDSGRWFHETFVENGADNQFTCNACL
jgi:hypothetical protein